MRKLLAALTLIMMVACQSGGDQADSKKQNELWVYTSLYKDTISDLEKLLAQDFPGVKFNFYQAGSEDIATKVNAEILAGGTKADVLISSDRFWYEEMANSGNLHQFQSQSGKEVPAQLKHPQSFYSTLSIPVMVLAYNKEAITADKAPKTFKEMSEARWKGKFSTGSPLASGTNFTTMAMLQHHYGWDYFKNLRSNDTIAQGGNSAVVRRLQSKERPVGWVLLENLLRFQGKDDRLQIVYPEDGVVTHANVIAITKKKGERSLAERFVEWMYSEKGQNAMTRSYMYSPLAKFAPPAGAPPFSKILENSFPWTKEFLQKVVKERSSLKEVYTSIMFE